MPRDVIERLRVDVGSPALEGVLTLPSSQRPVPAVLLLAGSGPHDADETIGPNKPFRELADGLAERGVATLRVDKRTLTYPGTINLATFTAAEEYVPDALAALRLLRTRDEVDAKRIFVLGHSLGGTLAPRVAAADKSVAGIILMAALSDSFSASMLRQVHYLATLPGTAGERARSSIAAVEKVAAKLASPDLSVDDKLDASFLGGAGPAYFLDLRDYDEVAVARSLNLPILILQGERDYQVTVENDFNVWVTGLAGADVTTHRYPSANHLFANGGGPPTPAEYEARKRLTPEVIRDIAAWIETAT